MEFNSDFQEGADLIVRAHKVHQQRVTRSHKHHAQREVCPQLIDWGPQHAYGLACVRVQCSEGFGQRFKRSGDRRRIGCV